MCKFSIFYVICVFTVSHFRALIPEKKSERSKTLYVGPSLRGIFNNKTISCLLCKKLKDFVRGVALVKTVNRSVECC